MLKIKESVIVEGKYDKIKLSGILDTLIIEVNGFSLFKDKEKMDFIKNRALETGIIILTDSDGAGFLIRNHICGCIDKRYIKHAYIPEIKGREKRKTADSKEGILGVEGVSDEIILKAIINCGATEKDDGSKDIKAADLFEDGIIGNRESGLLRKRIKEVMRLPQKLSNSALLRILNDRYTYEEYKELVAKIKKSDFI